ncbi:MAG: prepilin peptidase [Roseburia sp.]
MTLPTFLTVAVVTDCQSGKISNRLIALGLATGLMFRILGEGYIGIVHFLVNTSVPVILLFILFQMRALGAGDIKLFSVIGSFVTIRQLCYVVAASFIVGAVIGAGKLAYQKLFLRICRGKKTIIHFSIPILIGYLFIVWGCAIE